MTASPHIAFGLQALALALKARAGRLKMAEAAGLAGAHCAAVPRDADAALAVVGFLAGLNHDAARAGAELQAFLLTWRGGVVAEAAADPGTGPPELFDWQTRADTGLD